MFLENKQTRKQTSLCGRFYKGDYLIRLTSDSAELECCRYQAQFSQANFSGLNTYPLPKPISNCNIISTIMEKFVECINLSR